MPFVALRESGKHVKTRQKDSESLAFLTFLFSLGKAHPFAWVQINLISVQYEFINSIC